MQRVDLIVDNQVVNTRQRSDLAAFQRRVTAAYQVAKTTKVIRSAPIPAPPAPHPPSKPAHPILLPPSVFSGRGVFTTTDTDTALPYHADWTAVQVDPEGDATIGPVPGTLCYWAARPTKEQMTRANAKGHPFIGQAESQAELEICLALNPNVPHALVGNPQTWDDAATAEAIAKGWDLILEWYWNNTPAYSAPNADNYPLFRNVCFGTFPSETVPGRRVYVDEYRAVWQGPFSIWDSEGATERDKIGFNIP